MGLTTSPEELMLSLDRRRPTTKELPIKLSKTNVVAIMNVLLRFQWLKLNKSRVFFNRVCQGSGLIFSGRSKSRRSFEAFPTSTTRSMGLSRDSMFFLRPGEVEAMISPTLTGFLRIRVISGSVFSGSGVRLKEDRFLGEG